MKRVFLATCAKIPNLAGDDQALIKPLADLGIRAQAAIWNDATVPWPEADAVIIRSCWDYHLYVDQFLDWIASLEAAGVRVWNHPQTVRWNSNKIYLRDLVNRGIPVIPTFWPETAVHLQSKLLELGWHAAVVKPRVSATAYRTAVVTSENADQGQSLLDDLVMNPGAIVQKFMENVRQGEWSLVYFAGNFSHAVIKIPKAGDFRVQEEHGGNIHAAEPPRFVLEATARAVATIDPTPLYARVDGVEADGRFLLMELELIEPALYVTLHCSAAARFAREIATALG
jgi:glutathione synthase/RimK-type ligase-like ATP-grasp enzyme